jgi:ribonuclease HII
LLLKKSQPKFQKLVDQSYSITDQIIIAGVDEVGRGPWAGPIVACAYIEVIPVNHLKITDSKKMNQAQREEAYDALILAGHYGIGQADAKEIDKLGMTKANRLAFKRALEALPVRPDLVLIDGKDRLGKVYTLSIPFKTFIKGDLLIKVISCASIIAKVTRDRLMVNYAKQFPKYRFDQHKGYGTLLHRNAIKKHGVTEIHRKSFRPVKLAISSI